MIVNVIPKSRMEHALSTNKGIFSVSLCADRSRLEHVCQGYSWAVDRYDDLAVFLGDNPLITSTLRILGYSAHDAQDTGSRLAAEALEKLDSVQPVRNLVAASDLAKTPCFQAKLGKLQKMVAIDDALQAAAFREADKFVARVARQSRLALPEAEAIALSFEYVLYEVAMYAHLADIGYFIDIYVGEELAILRHFMYGRLTGFPELEKRAFISLEPELQNV